MITEIYRSPSYRPELVAHRYVKRVNGARYRVYECAAKKKAQNRLKALSSVGAGPTIREYDTFENGIPPAVARQLAYVTQGTMISWP